MGGGLDTCEDICENTCEDMCENTCEDMCKDTCEVQLTVKHTKPHLSAVTTETRVMAKHPTRNHNQVHKAILVGSGCKNTQHGKAPNANSQSSIRSHACRQWLQKHATWQRTRHEITIKYIKPHLLAVAAKTRNMAKHPTQTHN